jgi:hypothetical protein
MLRESCGGWIVYFFIGKKISGQSKKVTKMDDMNSRHQVDIPEVTTLQIAVLINFAGRRWKFHRFTNKRDNSDIIQDPLLSQ